jgi:deoxyribodipyrimidine photo-lyase
MTEIHIFLFRRDFRIHDNLALNRLVAECGSSGGSIYPMFIFNPAQIYAKNNPYFSNNCVQFMIESLDELDTHIHVNYHESSGGSSGKDGSGKDGSGDIGVLTALSKKYKIKTIAYNKDYSPFAIKRDRIIEEWAASAAAKAAASGHDIRIITEEDYTLYPMGTIQNNKNEPYKVFTPFYKKSLSIKVKPCVAGADAKSIAVVKHIKGFDKHRYYEPNDDIAVRGGRDKALERFKKIMTDYAKTRDYPALDKTTRLSAYIKFGCVSIREVYYNYKNVKELQRELLWREFYANILYYFPHVLGNAFKEQYDNVKWTNNKEWFKRWCQGKTGYVMVDAGMAQLNKTGWMHNRLRMITAMFLTKDLLIDWRWGEKYFATKLVDYDPASNNGGWQWSASTGTDSQPYFRIFNPELQLKRYDKDYEYIRTWIPAFETDTEKIVERIVEHKERSAIAIREFKRAASA